MVNLIKFDNGIMALLKNNSDFGLKENKGGVCFEIIQPKKKEGYLKQVWQNLDNC